jgi:hypothetical protein
VRSHTRKSGFVYGIPILGLLCAMGCGEDFAPFNEIEGFRLLGLAADKPALNPTQTATLTALVRSDAPTTYDWSWCPVTGGQDSAFGCLLDEALLNDLVGSSTGTGSPPTLPAFALGTSTTATFTHSISKEILRGACDLVQSTDLPRFALVPDCQEVFPITIRLEVTSGEETIIGIKSLDLLYDTDQPTPNQNPVIEAVRVVLPQGSELVLPPNLPTPLQRGALYRILLTIPESAAESYIGVPPDGTEPATLRETLVVSWLIRGGLVDSARTSFKEGESPLDETSTNLWRLPTELQYADGIAELVVVIRDNRGGASWVEREIVLE